MKNIDSQTTRALGVLINGKPYQAYGCRLDETVLASMRTFPLEIVAGSEHKVDLVIPKGASVERNSSLQIDLPVEDGIEND